MSAPTSTLAPVRPQGTVDDQAVRRVARTGLANLAGSALGGLAGLGVTWLVARGVGPEHAGAFFAGTAAFTLATAAARLGTPTGLVFWPAQLRARGDHHLIRDCLRAGLVPVALAALAIAAGLWLLAPLLPGYGPQVRLLAVFLPVATMSDACLAATRGFRHLRPTLLLDRLLRPALQLSTVGILVLAGVLGTAAYGLAWAGPYVPVAVLAAICLRRVTRHRLPRSTTVDGRTWFGADARMTRAFWRFTAPRAVGSVAQSALQRLDVLLVATLAGLRTAAVYAVATRFIVLSQLVNQAIGQVVQPRLAERLAVRDHAGANALYQTATGWLVFLTWPLHLLAIWFAPVYLRLFGPGYGDGATAVVVLASALVVATGCGMVDMVLSMAGRTSWNLANVGLALAVQLGAAIVLIPRYGLLGAAIALAAALVVNNVVPLSQVGLSLGLHPFGAGTVAAGGLAVASYGAVPLLVVAVAGRSPIALLGAVVVATVGYAAGALALRRVLRLDGLLRLRRTRTTPVETR